MTAPSIKPGDVAAGTTAPALLRLEDVHFAYRQDRPVIRGVSASLAPGRVTAIVGPNGAGKSTLLRLMLGTLTPTSGRALLNLDGQSIDVSRMPPRRRAAHVAYVPQQPSAGDAFTVEQIVRLGRLARPVSPDAVARAIERASLNELKGELFGTLSAGQQQRVALARALAQLSEETPLKAERAHAQAILADEPSSAMDPAHLVRAMEILMEEATAGRTVIVVLHDITTALRFAHDALVLDSTGRLAARGPAEEVLTPPTLAAVYGIDFERLGPDEPARGAALVPVHAPRGR